MSKPQKSYVLVSVDGNDVDWITIGDAEVILLDYAKLERSFPDVIEATIKQVEGLPSNTPWKWGALKRLRSIHNAAQDLITQPN